MVNLRCRTKQEELYIKTLPKRYGDLNDSFEFSSASRSSRQVNTSSLYNELSDVPTATTINNLIDAANDTTDILLQNFTAVNAVSIS